MNKLREATLLAAAVAGGVSLPGKRDNVVFEWTPGDEIKNWDHLSLAKACRKRLRRLLKRTRPSGEAHGVARVSLLATEGAIKAWEDGGTARNKARRLAEKQAADEAAKEKNKG